MIASAKQLASLARTDAKRIHANSKGLRGFFHALSNPSFRAAFLIRVALLGNPVLHTIARNLLISLFSIDIGKGARIGPGLYLPHPIAIVIGQGACLGTDVTLYQGVTLGRLMGKYPMVSDRAILYPNAIVIGAIAIPADCRVPPGSIIRPNENSI